MRATLTDIATQSGVSNATVDRVLNHRPGVRARTREIVLATAARLGYLPDEAPPAAPDHLTLDFVLPAGTNSFIRLLEAELRRQADARPGLTANLHLVEGFNPDTLAAKLHQLEGTTSALAVIAIDHPTVRDALRRLAQRDVKIVTLVSDIQNIPRFGYVGIDNRTAGRLSGYLMSRFLGPGQHKVAMFAGSVSYRGHEEREMGFRHLVSEQPHLQITGFSEVRDDDTRAYAAARDHLTRHPDLAAIYNIGGGNAGIAKALEESGRAREVVFIGHDLTEHTKTYLLSGTMDAVIDQNPRVQAREALDQLSRALRALPWNAHPLRTQIICRENIPED